MREGALAHGGPPPVHDRPAGLSNGVEAGVALCETQGVRFVIHTQYPRAKPARHDGRQSQPASHIKTGTPGDVVAPFPQPVAQGHRRRPEFRPVGQAIVVGIGIVAHGVPQGFQIGGPLQTPQASAGTHRNAWRIGGKTATFFFIDAHGTYSGHRA